MKSRYTIKINATDILRKYGLKALLSESLTIVEQQPFDAVIVDVDNVQLENLGGRQIQPMFWRWSLPPKKPTVCWQMAPRVFSLKWKPQSHSTRSRCHRTRFNGDRIGFCRRSSQRTTTGKRHLYF